MDEAPLPTEEQKKSVPVGPIFATAIIVIVVLVGGIYFLIQQEKHVRELKLQQQQEQLPANS